MILILLRNFCIFFCLWGLFLPPLFSQSEDGDANNFQKPTPRPTIQSKKNAPRSKTASPEKSKPKAVSSKELSALSLVQIRVTYQTPNYLQPWKPRNPESRIGNGIVTSSKNLLVPIEIVRNATLIEAKKSTSSDPIAVEVIATNEDLGLALIGLPISFSIDLEPISFQSHYNLQNSVKFWSLNGSLQLETKQGRLLNFDTVSTENGLVEVPTLEVSSTQKLQVFGELVTQDDLPMGVLISTSAGRRILPSDMIQDFLKSGETSGQRPFKGFRYRPIQDKATRDYYKIPDAKSGVVVASVFPGSSVDGVLQVGDILMEVDQIPLDGRGNLVHPRYGVQNISFYFQWKDKVTDLGEVITLSFLREGRTKTSSIQLRPFPKSSIRIPYTYDLEQPPYSIIGGYVFLELSEPMLKEWGKNWRARADKKFSYWNDYHRYLNDLSNGRIVILSQVFPDETNLGYQNLRFQVVHSANGKEINNIKELEDILYSQTTDSILLLSSGEEIGIDSLNLNEIDKRISSKYGVPRRRSP